MNLMELKLFLMLNKNSKIMITGANGFVGINLTKKFIELGFSPLIVVKNKIIHNEILKLKKKVSIHILDLSNNQKIKKIIDSFKPDILIHLASTNINDSNLTERDHININLIILLNLLDALKGSKTRVIFSGSVAKYEQNKLVTEKARTFPPNFYGLSKFLVPEIANKIAHLYKLEFIELVLFSPYGPFEKKQRLIPYILRQALYEDEIIIKSFTEKRDYVYISDVVNAFILACKKRLKHSISVNICSGNSINNLNVVRMILSQIGVKKKIKNLNLKSDITYHSKNVLAKKYLKWEPIISFQKGIEIYVDFLMKKEKLYE